MKKSICTLLLLFIMSGLTHVSGQKIKVLSGNRIDLKGEKELNVSYDYSSFGVGKFETEEEYLSTKKTEYEAKEKGRGEKFEKGWVDAREQRYEPKFEELINKYTGKQNLKVGGFPNAKYTLIVKTTFLEPGFNVGVMKKPAYVNFEYIFVETANPENVLWKLEQLKVPGSQFGGYDFDVGSRVAESYAKGGKMLGSYLIK